MYKHKNAYLRDFTMLKTECIQIQLLEILEYVDSQELSKHKINSMKSLLKAVLLPSQSLGNRFVVQHVSFVIRRYLPK